MAGNDFLAPRYAWKALRHQIYTLSNQLFENKYAKELMTNPVSPPSLTFHEPLAEGAVFSGWHCLYCVLRLSNDGRGNAPT